MKPGEKFDPATQTAYLVTGRLSLAALAELLKRTKAGEDGNRVRVELLIREGKVTVST